MPTPIDGTWGLDTMHSTVSFSVRYLTNRFRREFTSVDAKLVDGKLSGTADVQSLDLRVDMFREHVIDGPAFFDAGSHPTLAFESNDLQVDGSDAVLEGDLTIKGVTKPIRATGSFAGPIEDQQGRSRIGLTLTTTIDRTDFDIGSEFPVQAMGREVDLDVDLFLVAA